MNDVMAIARATQVWVPEEYYRRQLERIDERRQRRTTYVRGAVSFASVFAFYMLGMALIIGGWS